MVVCVYDAMGEPAWSSADFDGGIVGSELARQIAGWTLRAIAAESAILARAEG